MEWAISILYGQWYKFNSNLSKVLPNNIFGYMKNLANTWKKKLQRLKCC